MCDYYEKYGLKLQSGELDSAEQLLFNQHCETCESCRKNLNTEDLVKDFLKSNSIKAPAELNRYILLQIKPEKQKTVGFSKKAIYTLSIAASTVLLFLISNQLTTEKETLSDWLPEENLTELNEISALEDRIALLESDYRQTTTTTAASTSEEIDKIDNFEESIDIIDTYDALY